MFIMSRYKICDRCVIWIVSVIWGTTPLMLWEMWCKEFMLCTFFFCKCNNCDQNSKGEVQQVLGLTTYYNIILSMEKC